MVLFLPETARCVKNNHPLRPVKLLLVTVAARTLLPTAVAMMEQAPKYLQLRPDM